MFDIWIHAITDYPQDLAKKLDPTLSKAAGKCGIGPDKNDTI